MKEFLEGKNHCEKEEVTDNVLFGDNHSSKYMTGKMDI